MAWVEEAVNKTGFALGTDEIVNPDPPGWTQLGLEIYAPLLPTKYGGTGKDLGESTGVLSITDGVVSAGNITHADITNFDVLFEGKLSRSGDSMSGELDMNENGITHVTELIMMTGENGISLDSGNNYFTEFLDEDTMSSNSETAIASQQSIKAYVDSRTLNDISGVSYGGSVLDIQGLTEIDYFEGTQLVETDAVLFTIDTPGKIALDSEEGEISFKDGSIGTLADIVYDGGGGTPFSAFTIYNPADTPGDYFKIETTAEGATTISTNDSNSDTADITISPDGKSVFTTNVHINGAGDQSLSIYNADGTDFGTLYNNANDFIIKSGGDTTHNLILNYDAGGQLEFWEDGTLRLRHDGPSTKFTHDANNYFEISVDANGATVLQTLDGGVDKEGHLQINPDGDLSFSPSTNNISFESSSVGFERQDTTAAPSTSIDFKQGNKHHLDIIIYTGITVNLKFPATSGNHILVVQQDDPGGRTVSTWNALDKDDNACNNDGGTAGAIRWQGGTAPTLSTAANSARSETVAT